MRVINEVTNLALLTVSAGRGIRPLLRELLQQTRRLLGIFATLSLPNHTFSFADPHCNAHPQSHE